jgi:hypothetical protein
MRVSDKEMAPQVLVKPRSQDHRTLSTVVEVKNA